MKKRTTRTTTPAQLAAREVQAWFESMLVTIGAHVDGHVDQVSLDAGMNRVQEALKREHVREHGPIKPDEDMVDEMFALEAGYLIGVQVGLRLRTTGGAR